MWNTIHATCGVRTAARVQASLRDAMRFPRIPGVETPGYCRWSLRDLSRPTMSTVQKTNLPQRDQGEAVSKSLASFRALRESCPVGAIESSPPVHWGGGGQDPP